MKDIARVFHCYALFILSFPLWSQAADVSMMTNAIKTGAVVPVISAANDEIKSISAAYQFQRRIVDALLGDKSPSGFKAGLTSSDTQQRFVATQAVAGVLLPQYQSVQKQNIVIKSSDYQRGVVELELGFRLNRRIVEPLTDLQQLPNLVAEVVAVVELPETGFVTKPKLADIIASNVGARRWLIAGSTKNNLYVKKINLVDVKLLHEQQLLIQGRGADALGDQWRALQFLINRTIASGWQIEPGQLLITGALGQVIPMRAGKYHASWSGLAELDFVVE